MTARPARVPCGSCPYRKDVPSGVWHESEYHKLPLYDNEMAYQPPAAFYCHQQDGRLCAGWVGCHDMQQSLGLRIAVIHEHVSPGDADAVLDYECPVPLWESGAAAAAHGLAEVPEPGEPARRVIERLERKRQRKGAGNA